MPRPSIVPSHVCSEAEAGELAQLRERLAVLEQAQSSRRSRGRWAAVALTFAITAGTLALAAPGDCPNGMPFCFVADTPASAAQVNENFAYLRGLNAAWSARVPGGFPLPVGVRTLVTSVTVPAGSYVVAGKVYGVTSSTGGLLCSLQGPAGLIDATNAQPVNAYATAPMLGTITLATGGTLSLECLGGQGSLAYTLYSASIVATPVSTVN